MRAEVLQSLRVRQQALICFKILPGATQWDMTVPSMGGARLLDANQAVLNRHGHVSQMTSYEGPTMPVCGAEAAWDMTPF